MLCCDLTLDDPASNLALDEALLDECEGGVNPPLLRFWSPAISFVVVGYANTVASEVDVPACERRGIRILRRCSGGGTVLQGPGCLNYSVILKTDSDPLLGGITGTNHYVMERNRTAIERLVGRRIELAGHTDLAIEGRKFCGNAQRRRRQWLIFHGCFLLSCDLSLMEQVLRMPTKRPEYRRDRRHSDFVMNLGVPETYVKAALREAWGVKGDLPSVPHARFESLMHERYSRHEWHFKF